MGTTLWLDILNGRDHLENLGHRWKDNIKIDFMET
jgi:hypothetical protein